MSHTPGPWKAMKTEHGWHVGPQPDGVCSIWDNTDSATHATQEANARLLAAAPDLLEACEAIADAMSDAQPGGLARIRRALKQVADTIAKAKGVQS